LREWLDADGRGPAPEGLTEQLLVQGKEDASAAVELLVAAGLGDLAAEHLAGLDHPLVDANALYDLVTHLHGAGEIRRPHALLRAYEGRVSSGRLRDAMERRAFDMATLDGDFQTPIPTIHRYVPDRDWDSLYLLHNSLPHQLAGYATRTHGLLGGLLRNGRSVAAVTRPGFPSDRGQFNQRSGIAAQEEIDGVTYHRLIGPVDAQPRKDLGGWVQLYGTMMDGLLRHYRPPILHAASNWWNGQAAVSVARAIGVKSVYEIRGLWEITRASRVDGWMESDVYRLDAEREAQAARGADRVITITNGLKQEMVGRGVSADRVTVVPNAVDTNRFGPSPRDPDLEARLGLEGRRVVGFVGTLTDYEGLDDLLDAAARLRDSTENPFTLLIVGDGPVREELEDRAERLGIANRCRFIGRVPHDEVERYLSLIDITPFPRKPLPVCEMVSPLKPLESMASGIAVMSSDVAALDEMLAGGPYGLIHRKGDTAHLAEVLGRMIDDPELCEEVSGRALDWVRAERNWQAVSCLVADVYDELTGEL